MRCACFDFLTAVNLADSTQNSVCCHDNDKQIANERRALQIFLKYFISFRKLDCFQFKCLKKFDLNVINMTFYLMELFRNRLKPIFTCLELHCKWLQIEAARTKGKKCLLIMADRSKVTVDKLYCGRSADQVDPNCPTTDTRTDHKCPRTTE
jgi:hypothetical protein